MRAELTQAGERLVIRSALPWLDPLLREAVGDAARPVSGHPPTVQVDVVADRDPFDVRDWESVTRGAHQRSGRCVLENACGSGFDLRIDVDPLDRLTVEARWRPPLPERLAASALRSRFHLLARAVLLQYPALWRAGWEGRVPMHAAAVAIGNRVPLLVGPGGVGRSTLLLEAAARGGRACSDNVCVGDLRAVHGIVEPVRVEGGSGRRMPHGRRERSLPGRVDLLRPDRIVVLRRGTGVRPWVRPLDPARAAAVLIAGTYMAGELRRYWGFAATLAIAVGRGPVHPPLVEVATELAQRLPAVEITLGATPTPGLADLLISSTRATDERPAVTP